MKEYNYDEIKQMQERALERVKDMQMKTHQLVNADAQKEQEHKQYRDNFYNAVKASSKANYIKMPVELDDEIKDYRSFEKYFVGTPQQSDEASENVETLEKHNVENPLKDLINEPDKALILALLLLLRADKADEELIMSLLYIML